MTVELHIGAAVQCRDAAGVFRPCDCGCEDFIVAPGVGPHAAQMRCIACGRGGRWLSKFVIGERRP